MISLLALEKNQCQIFCILKFANSQMTNFNRYGMDFKTNKNNNAICSESC